MGRISTTIMYQAPGLQYLVTDTRYQARLIGTSTWYENTAGYAYCIIHAVAVAVAVVKS